MVDSRLTIRLSLQDIQIIDMFLKSGEFSSRSEFIRRAVREYQQTHMEEIIKNRMVIYKVIMVIEIILIIILFLIPSKERGPEIPVPEEAEKEIDGSIFEVLPYEGESFSVYYFPDSDVFSVQIRKPPYDESLDEAMEFLHHYEETKDFTEGDVRVVAPSYFYQE